MMVKVPDYPVHLERRVALLELRDGEADDRLTYIEGDVAVETAVRLACVEQSTRLC